MFKTSFMYVSRLRNIPFAIGSDLFYHSEHRVSYILIAETWGIGDSDLDHLDGTDGGKIWNDKTGQPTIPTSGGWRYDDGTGTYPVDPQLFKNIAYVEVFSTFVFVFVFVFVIVIVIVIVFVIVGVVSDILELPVFRKYSM